MKFVIVLLLLLNNQSVISQSLLWKISGNGLTTPSYVFGTMHLLCEQDFVLSTSIEKAIDSTHQMIMEIDLDAPADPNIAMAMLMKNNTTLKKLLPKRKYKKIQQYIVDSLQMNMTALEHLQPYLLVSTLYPSVMHCKIKSYEAEFLYLAKDKNKEIIGLETIEEQFKLFDKIPYKKQAKELYDFITNKNTVANGIYKMIDLYKKQDIENLQKAITTADGGMTGDVETTILTDRNTKWIPLISKQIHTIPSFIAVGAGHLGGVNGVINLLKMKGYTVTPILTP